MELHLATRKGLFTFTLQNGQWRHGQASFLGDNCTNVMDDPRDIANGMPALYAMLDHGHFGNKLHRSRDGGRSWQEIGCPQYPEKPADYEPSTRPAEGEPVPWTLKLVWVMETGGPQQDGLLWAGTLPGGLFRSDDHGDSWQLVEPLWYEPKREEWFGGGADWPGIHSIIVDPRDHDHITLGISCGGVWHSHDGGKSWRVHEGGMRADFMPPERAYDSNIQDPHRIVACPANSDVMWVQHHNGIFRSQDAGMNWTEIENAQPSAFGFGVVVHPQQPETAWFVPGVKDETRIPVDGKLVVTRTTDGGRSFDVLSKGLPQQHAYHLVFRHALDIDSTGKWLAFGSTTGSLFVSDDGGESWHRVTAELPPIYAVRFSAVG